ncbi:hypothetical protein SpCBS45565_g04734 [Spizellomyces sp. 'palustris']|nr:hypothetical protein SpCBS45565_g04734 [Spizellomyces sp. 'palustris']
MSSSRVRATLFRALYVIPPALVFLKFGYTVGSVNGRSMQPTFNPDSSGLRKDWVLLDRFSPACGKYDVGDVVILSSPSNPEMKLIKRIVALGGDAIRPRHGPGEGVAPGSWIIKSQVDEYVRIPKGHCWVESDEPYRGLDSNVFGPVPLGLIDARVDRVIWPLDRFHKINRILPKPGRVVKSGRLTFEFDDADDAKMVPIWKT